MPRLHQLLALYNTNATLTFYPEETWHRSPSERCDLSRGHGVETAGEGENSKICTQHEAYSTLAGAVTLLSYYISNWFVMQVD